MNGYQLGAGAGLLGFIGAAALALLPLPTVDTLGGPVAWCGPGTTSASALRVALQPNIVNEGATDDVSFAQEDELVQVCKGAADRRLTQSAVAGGAGAVLGGGLFILGGIGTKRAKF